MNFNKLFFTFGSLLMLLGCQSTSVERESIFSLDLDERNGIKSYQKGEYKKSFELLKKPAAWGYKGAQYTIAFMFLKGQYVQQSSLMGMGWLGVATEVETEGWSEQYRAFYSAASKEQKLKINKIVKVYIERYGMKSQHITCKKSPTTRTRRVEHVCRKSENLSVIYPVDLVE